MTGLQFITILMGPAAGFALALWIFSTLLEKKNNLGDSHGDPHFYSNGMYITDRSERMYPKIENVTRYIDQHTPKKPTYPLAPNTKDKVRCLKKR
ncbi:MAG: hypothetical protein J6Y08_03920 [Clostridiales bacterium]|nr:hypothetical protein [Clostridiales bacterium]